MQHKFIWLALYIFILGGCSAQVSTAEIRKDLDSGNYKELGPALHTAYKKHPVMINALNLGRFYQFQGQWDESIQYFGEARSQLEDYEQRAIVNVRNVGSNISSLTLSRGAVENFGTGYERSLLHTFNSMNYLMKNDFQGAAVEMRRMEQRQEMWLEEIEPRVRKRVKKEQKRQSKNSDADDYSATNLPDGYSMSAILSDPALRQVVNAYQDPFSYSLSAIICRIFGDMPYAGVSLSRATQLDERAYQMFRSAWQPAQDSAKANNNGKSWKPSVPPLPRQYRAGAANNPPTQELTFVYFGGLAPAMKMEQIRIPQSDVGYILIDLPAFEPEVPAKLPRLAIGQVKPSAGASASPSGEVYGSALGQASSELLSAPASELLSEASGKFLGESSGELTAYPLLRPDLLAYQNLRDDISYEITAAITRGVARAAVSLGGQAIASSNDNTEAFSPLIGLLLTVAMDAHASSDNDKMRNWELLPARGFLGMTNLPRGSSVILTFGANIYTVELPVEARGIIVMASQVENANLKVDYVTY